MAVEVEITVEKRPDSELKPLFADSSKLGFGRVFTDHMFTMYFRKDAGGWVDPKIGPYQNLSLAPSTIVFHYAQEIFEGTKAFVGPDNGIRLFRPERNIQRMNNSARRLCMPTVPDDLFMQAIVELVNVEKRWIPREPGTALYIRPTLMGIDPFLGVRASNDYLFFIILSPVGPYYPQGFNPIPLYVCHEYVRAAKGGIGEAKAGANYAASLLAGELARQRGCSQVLWLDPLERKYVEEVGAMNMFFVLNGTTVVTPPLSGSILPGVTRASVLELAPTLGFQVEERRIALDEVLSGIKDGVVTEIFGAGTAAVISPVGRLVDASEEYVINDNQVGPVARKLYDTLTGIQRGSLPDPFGWVKVIGQI